MLIVESGQAPVSSVAFSTDAATVYVGHDDGSLSRVTPGGAVESLGAFGSRVHAIAARPKTDDVYACCTGWIATINPDSPPGKPSVLSRRTGPLTAIAFVSDDLLASGTGDLAKVGGGSASFDDLKSNKVVGRVVNEAGGIRSFACHRPTRTIAWATGDRLVRIMPLAKPDAMKLAFDQNATALAWSADGTRIMAGLGWIVRGIDPASRRTLFEATGHKGRVTGIEALPDGSFLSAAWDELIHWWSPDGELVRTLAFGIGKLTALAVSEDGSRAAAGGARGNVVMWDLM